MQNDDIYFFTSGTKLLLKQSLARHENANKAIVIRSTLNPFTEIYLLVINSPDVCRKNNLMIQNMFMLLVFDGLKKARFTQKMRYDSFKDKALLLKYLMVSNFC